MKNTHLLLITFLMFSGPGMAQSDTNSELNKPTMVLLGTFHFAGSTDAMSLKVDDLSSPKRQKEIEVLIEALVQYKPTKIILEYSKDNNEIDSLYQLYLNKTHELTINERQQVGFRMASKMGHKNVYPADFHLDLSFNSLIAFLEENEISLYSSVQKSAQNNFLDA